MNYTVAVYDSDGQKYKVYRKCKKFETAKKSFNKILENNVVFFERKTLNRKDNHKELKFYLYLLKDKEDGDEEIPIRDDLGRLIREKFKDTSYSILNKSPFKIEETFLAFGVKGRLNFRNILKKFLMNNNRVKYVYYFLNKVIIEDYDDINIIICKNKKESRLLHDTLFEFFRFNKIKKGIFMNELKKENRKRIYKDILEKTGWKPSRLYRNSTRP